MRVEVGIARLDQLRIAITYYKASVVRQLTAFGGLFQLFLRPVLKLIDWIVVTSLFGTDMARFPEGYRKGKGRRKPDVAQDVRTDD